MGRNVAGLLSALIFIAPAVHGLPDHVELIVVPEQEARLDEVIVVGTSVGEIGGVSEVIVPGDDGLYVALDVQDALEQQVRQVLSDIYGYGSDISIYRGIVMGEAVHLDLAGDPPTAIFLTGEPSPIIQVFEHAQSGGGLRARIEIREYRFPIEECHGLDGKVEAVRRAVEAAARSLGTRELRAEITLDGPSLDVTLRLQGTNVGYGVGSDNAMFEPFSRVWGSVTDCAADAGDYKLVVLEF